MSASQISVDLVVKHAPNQIATDLGSDTVILNLSDGVYYGLNDVGSFVWNEIATPLSIADLCTAVANEFEVDEDVCRQDVCDLVKDLLAKDLVEIAG